MLKILIVDDEPDICELINRLIDWENLGLMSLGMAQNGMDAMEIILRQDPDIVVTDVQMPGMTGLEMIEKACQQKLNTRFIVISGYREFEYAQKAMHFGVEDYLLKPISKQDLNLVLQRLIQQLGHELNQKSAEESIRAELQQKNSILRENELRRLLSESTHTIQENLFHFHGGLFLAVCVHVSFRKKEEIEFVTIQNVLKNIAMRLRERMKDEVYDSEYTITDCNVYFLMNFSGEQHCSYKERREILQELLDECSVQYQNLCITIAMGTPCYDLDEIGEALQSAEEGDLLRLYAGSRKVVEQRKLRTMLPDRPECTVSVEQRQKLFHMMTLFQEDEATRFVRTIYTQFQEAESYAISNLFQVTRSLIMSIRYEMAASGLRGETIAAENDVPLVPAEDTIHRRLANCDTIEELCEFVCEYVSAEIAYCRYQQEQKIAEPIRLAQEYIKENCARQLSLDEVAAQAFVSPGYLSALFKEQTGQNFTDYITEIRIEKAKLLLRSRQNTVNDVAEQVGYGDAKYFSRVFRKVVGVNPADYRKFYV